MIKGKYIEKNNWLNGTMLLVEVSMGSDTEDFFWQNYTELNSDAEASFLKALKIPVAFFRKLDAEAKKKVIHSQTQLLLSDGKNYVEAIWALVNKEAGVIQYVGRKVATPFDYATPETFFWDDQDKWMMFEVNFNKGTVAFLRILDEDAKDVNKHYPCVVVTFSLLYQRDVKIDMGVYRPLNNSFLIDSSIGKVYYFKCTKFDSTRVQGRVNIAKEAMEACDVHKYEYMDVVEDASLTTCGYDTLNDMVQQYEWITKDACLRKVISEYNIAYVKTKDEILARVKTWLDFIGYAFDTISLANRELQMKLRLGTSLYKLIQQKMTRELGRGVRIEGGQ